MKIRFWNSVKFTYVAVLLFGAIIFIGLTFYSRKSIDQQNVLAYNDHRAQSISSFNEILDLRSTSLSEFVNENTYWDDMVNYVHKPNATFTDIYITPELSTHNLIGTWTYKKNYSLNSTATIYTDRNQNFNLGLTPQNIQRMFAHTYKTHYYQTSQFGLLEVFGSTVQGSDDADRKTPAEGYYFIARIVDKGIVDELQTQTADHVSLLTPEQGNAKSTDFPINSGTIAFKIDLRRFDGAISGEYYVTQQNQSITRIVSLADRLIFVTIIVYSLVCLLLLLAFAEIIAHPLSIIHRTLQTKDLSHIHRLRHNRSEFGRIATLIATAALQQAELEKNIKEIAKAKDTLQQRSEELEKTNKLMMNRELKMIELKQQIAELKSKSGGDGNAESK